MVNTATDLLSSKVTLIVGRAACMFCGLGGRIRIGTIPNMAMNIIIYCSINHPLMEVLTVMYETTLKGIKPLKIWNTQQYNDI